MREIIFADGHTVNVQKAEPGLTGRFFHPQFLAHGNGEEQQFLVMLESGGNSITRDFRKAKAAVRSGEELVLQVGNGMIGELPVVAFRKDSPKKLTFIVYCHPLALPGIILS